MAACSLAISVLSGPEEEACRAIWPCGPQRWRWVVLVAALAGAVLTPSTDPLTMLLLSGAITVLYLIGVGLVALSQSLRPAA